MLEQRVGIAFHPQSSTLPSRGESNASEMEGNAYEIVGDQKTWKPLYGGGAMPETAKEAISKWIFRHAHRPRPSDEQKEAWKKEFGIERRQIDTYCIHLRQNIWKPQLRSAIQLAREKKSWKGFVEMLERTTNDNPYRTFIQNKAS